MRTKYLIIAFTALLAMAGAIILTVDSANADSLEEVLKEAEEAYESKEWKKSIQLYYEVLDMDPSNVKARLALSKSYMQIDKDIEAIAILNFGIDKQKDEPEFYKLLSKIYLANENVSKALEVLKKGQKNSKDESLKKFYDEFVSNIQIHTERALVQKGFERKVTLTWEDDEGDVIPLKGEWKLSDSSIGTISPKKNKESLVFKAQKVGKTNLQVNWESLTRKVEFKVADQVLVELKTDPKKIEKLAKGQTMDVSVTALDEAGEKMDITPVWSTSEGVVEVKDQKGQSNTLTAKKEGKDTLKILYLDYKKEIDLVVDGKMKKVKTGVKGHGSVSVYPNQESFPVGEEISLKAVPSAGWKFAGWAGDLTTSSDEVNLTVEKNMDVTAVFERATHDLQLSVSGEGKIIKDKQGSTFNHSEEVSLKAQAADGWRFEGWEGSATGSSATVNVQMDKDKSVKAIFTKVEEEPEPEPEEEDTTNEDNGDEEEPAPEPAVYQLNTGVSGEGSIQKDQTGSEFKEGSNVQLTAKPQEGWVFKGWSGDISGSSATVTVTMDQDKTIQANFEKKPEPEPETYSLSTGVIGEGTVNTSSTSAQEGETITVEAVPSNGWQFVKWQGDTSGTNSVTKVTMDQNKEVTAVFEKVRGKPE
ncbi:InlB B-repeat-containing protein [Halobacillus mangrovi]|uniref:InlB B-repeat-containing protein n=1 Tax=Halobacillus mangrovi TaxID=402384 RepID=UPI003D99B5E6